MKKKEFDIIVIGGGASGLFAAIPLIEHGFSVAIIEKGRWKESAQYDNDELYTYIDQKDWPNLRDEFSVVDLSDATPPFIHRMGQSYGYVGGGTVTYAGVSERFRLDDFNKKSKYGSVTGLNLCNWPDGFYNELEPYYCLAEKYLGVSGHSFLDPTSPPRSNQLLKPLEMHEINLKMIDAAARLGWNPYPIPLAINSVYNSENNRNWCISSGLCSGYRCVWNSKGSSDEIFKFKLRNYSNYVVFTNHIAINIGTNKKGNEIESVVIRNRQTQKDERIFAKKIILGAGGVLSPVLLLLSANGKHPRGLSNNNDLVGRNLMFHIEGQKGANFSAKFKKFKFNNVKKIMITDYYYPSKEDDFINHFTIQAGSKTGPIRYVTKKNKGGWGIEYLKNVFDNFMNYFEFQVFRFSFSQKLLDNMRNQSPFYCNPDGRTVYQGDGRVRGVLTNHSSFRIGGKL